MSRPAATGEPGVRDAIDAHLDSFLGPWTSVWHEIVSDMVHLDVYMWEPTVERPMYTFVTVGMSDLPMSVPEGAVAAGYSRRTELMLCLPPDWPVPTGPPPVPGWDGPNAYLPIRWLKQLARLPHEYNSWLGFGHTIPNGEPAAPLAPITQLCGWVLLPPTTLPAGFRHIDLGSERLDIFGIVALHQDEMDHKLTHSAESLIDGFERGQVNELLDIKRRSSLQNS